MFTTREAIRDTTGVEIDQTTLGFAQMMIEAYIGRSDGDVTSTTDRDALARAVTFQAVYIKANPETVLEQAAITSVSQNEMSTTFNAEMFAPFMSPWAIMACKKLSWRGTRSVKIGPLTYSRPRLGWERE